MRSRRGLPAPGATGCTTDSKGNLVAQVYLHPGEGEYLCVIDDGPIDIKLKNSTLYPGHHYGPRIGDDLPLMTRVRNGNK